MINPHLGLRISPNVTRELIFHFFQLCFNQSITGATCVYKELLYGHALHRIWYNFFHQDLSIVQSGQHSLEGSGSCSSKLHVRVPFCSC